MALFRNNGKLKYGNTPLSPNVGLWHDEHELSYEHRGRKTKTKKKEELTRIFISDGQKSKSDE